MKQQNIFMTAHWNDLIISTFEVEKEILEVYLPNHTELDLFNGKALLSIVAFTFSKVKFFGLKVPFHQKFGQINFRFYAKSKISGAKGVVFIKEFAPKPLIALTANTFYNEPYFYKNITSTKTNTQDGKTITYSYQNMDIKATTNKTTTVLTQNSFDEFIVDRYIAFVKSKNKNTFQYKIYHKPWKLYQSAAIEVNKNLIALLPKVFKNIKYIKTCVVDGSFVSVQKGILQNHLITENLNPTLI